MRLENFINQRRRSRKASAFWDIKWITMAVKEQPHSLLVTCLLSSLLLQTCRSFPEELKWDENGYVLYCPCMGNFFFVTDPWTIAFCYMRATELANPKLHRFIIESGVIIAKDAHRPNMNPSICWTLLWAIVKLDIFLNRNSVRGTLCW